MLPTKIGRYEIKAELGRGGMATVYRAYDPSVDREVAIKVLPREFLHDPQFHDRFQREIKTIAALEHPAIVPVYDVGQDDGLPYFVMRFMTGGSLADWIKKGKIPLPDTARIIEKLAQALSYAHQKGIVHRDLKPDNILFDGNGDPFISDFGIAKFTEAASNLTGSGIIGTPAYMSPEQAQGEHVDSRSDIYALGVIIYQMLSGRQPYRADTPMGVVVKHITEPVPEILKNMPTLPEEADAVIKTAMAKNKDKRYASAAQLSQALNMAAFGAEGIESSSMSGETMSPRSSGSYKTGFIVGGIVALVALAGVFLLRNQLFVTAQETATPQPTAMITPTQPLPTSTLEPTAEATSTSTTIPLAPFCPSELLPQIATPAVRVTNKTCVKKIPYTTISIPEGSTFEPLERGFACASAGIVNGNLLISCTGRQLFSFDLKVCSPPTIHTPAPSLNAGQCPQDANYDAVNQCCVKPPSQDDGCRIFRVDLRGCS